MRQRGEKELRRDIDMIIDNVDKNRECTTSRMMSIGEGVAQGSPKYLYNRLGY